MTTHNDDPEAESRVRLGLFARELATTTPERRAELVAKVRGIAIPAALELLAEALLTHLDAEKTYVAVAEVLVALGPDVLPALESAVLQKQPEQRLLRLAPVFVALGRQLPEQKLVDLQITLGIAAGRARTVTGRAALEEAMWGLGDQSFGALPGLRTPVDVG